MAQKVTMKGNPLTLKGILPKVGDKAPDFTAVDTDLKPVKLSSFKGKVVLLLSVPSLDTDVCSRETHRFNEEVAKFGPQVATLTISMDLPFAQKRWCGQGVKNLQTLSDYQTREFGEKYGVLISELSLLARAVFLVDEKGIIRYVHVVEEVTKEPPYETVFKEVNQLLSSAR
jgi:thiol peroxidase